MYREREMAAESGKGGSSEEAASSQPSSSVTKRWKWRPGSRTASPLPGRYYSFRREGAGVGRIYGLIGVKT